MKLERVLCCAAVLLCTSLTTQNLLAGQPKSEVTESEAAVIRRLIQYESAIGYELKSGVDVCVDEAMGRKWLLPEGGDGEVSPASVEKIRRATETCTVMITSTDKTRLAAELRAMTERQLKLAQRLETSASTSRVCVKKSGSEKDYRACIDKAMGKSTSDAEWIQWLAIYERRNPARGQN